MEGRLIAIGSLTRSISPFLRESHPEIPWQALSAMGNNRIVAEYFRLDTDALWHTVREELPPVMALIEALLPAGGGRLTGCTSRNPGPAGGDRGALQKKRRGHGLPAF